MSFYLFPQSVSDIDTVIAERREKYSKCGLTLQVAIFAVTPVNKSNIYVVKVETITYVFDSVVKALDVAFKLTFTLNCKYCHEATQAYMFIQRHFFEIQCPGEHVSTNLAVLLKEMK